jgi:hypothetical protein
MHALTNLQNILMTKWRITYITVCGLSLSANYTNLNIVSTTDPYSRTLRFSTLKLITYMYITVKWPLPTM